MAPVGSGVHQNVSNKAKRPAPAGIQTNGIVPPMKNSPSPSMSTKKPPLSAKQPHSASERAITASTVRPVNRVRRDTLSQVSGRNSRNSAGLRSASLAADMTTHDNKPPPYVVTHQYILKKHAGRPPSLILHLHPTHFRFDNQEGMFPYKSPMRIFIEHLRSRTIPHELLPYFIDGGVPFYDGCLIVQVHDHRTVAQRKDIAKPTSTNGTVAASIHNSTQYLTPSPYVPYPKDNLANGDGSTKVDEDSKKMLQESNKENLADSSSDGQKSKTPTKPKTFTVVLHPTPESLETDLNIKAATPRGAADGGSALVPPSTPMSLVPPTPTAASMPPPAKRQKLEKMELDGSNIREAEGQILLATTAPLMLEPVGTVEERILLLEAFNHPDHSAAPPQPKTRKRTVAEMAADEAAAAQQERYMLFLDDRLTPNVAGAPSAGAGDTDAQTGAATFEPRFERFKVIEDIKREHAEKKEQEKIKQQENDRRLQQQKQQQQQEALALAQKQQQQQAAEQERLRREAAASREAAAQAQRQAAQAEAQRQARPATATPNPQNAQRQAMAQSQHAQPANNGAMNGAMANGMANGASAATPVPTNTTIPAQAPPRFQAQMSQPPAASPIIRQGTPQNMSSPMVSSVPMQQTNSGMAASPSRPSSVVQNHPMSVPMAHNMSSRGSQQSHPSGTPRMPNSTPQIPHGTPINRPAMVATPRMTQASPPPNMVAQNSQMGQAQTMMVGNQGMNQANPQLIQHMALQQRAIAQQQQQQQQLAAMQNGLTANMNGQMSPQQQQHMMQQLMQRQMALQQQQAQAQQQGGMMNPQQVTQQYTQQLQNMQGNQMRSLPPQMQAQLQQQMARMGQMNGQMGNPMQRQVSNQMMNGNNPNLQAIAAMQQQQQLQQAQQTQQQQQPSQPQQGGFSSMQAQVQGNARAFYQKIVQGLLAKHGALERIPQELMDKAKQTSILQAQQYLQQGIAQRRVQQQMLMQQQQQHQQQMQQMQQQQLQQQQMQQQQMQGMNGMMGPQGM